VTLAFLDRRRPAVRIGSNVFPAFAIAFFAANRAFIEDGAMAGASRVLNQFRFVEIERRML
jgi:hypothetical protein